MIKYRLFLIILPIVFLFYLLTFIDMLLAVRLFFLPFVIIPLIFIIGVIDVIINKEPNAVNFAALILSCILMEYIFKNNLFFYLIFLLPIVLLLFGFNKFKNQNLFKYSTIVIIIYTLIFTFSYQLSFTGVKKNLITNKYGFIMGNLCVAAKCLKYEIPIMYDDINLLLNPGNQALFGYFDGNILEVSKDGKNIFINPLNKQVLEEYDEAHFISRVWVSFFKVKNKNTKLGLVELYERYDGDSIESLIDNSKTKLVLPMIYDDITLVFSEKSIDFPSGTSCFSVITKIDNKYTLLAANRASTKNSIYFEYSPIFEDRDKIEQINFSDEHKNLLKDIISRPIKDEDWEQFIAINVDDNYLVILAPYGYSDALAKYSLWIYDTVNKEFVR